MSKLKRKVNNSECLNDMLAGFDEDRYQHLVAKMRILLVRGLVAQAVRALREFSGETESSTLSHETSIYECGLPYRTATKLDSAGYMTLGAVAGATRKEIASIRNLGEIGIQEIIDVVECWKATKH